MHNLHDKLIKVHDRLQTATEQAGRHGDTVDLLAVSKTQPACKIRELFALGQTRFGENYLQEALEKQPELADLSIEWHFIGPIQSNKTRAIAEHFQWVHSVDRIKVAERLNEHRPNELGPLDICLQVNIDKETSKSGVLAGEQLENLANTVLSLPHLRLRGLMAIPAPKDSWENQLASFQKVTTALSALKRQFSLNTSSKESKILDTLSMGMSGDLEAAITAGATLVRIGTGIFGPRTK